MRKQPQAAPADDWRDLRDERGKLCARIDTKRLVLEIQRSDRKQIARFDLRVYVVELRVVDNKPDTEQDIDTRPKWSRRNALIGGATWGAGT